MKGAVLRLISVMTAIGILLTLTGIGVSADEKSYGTPVENTAVLNSDTMRLEISKDGRVTVFDKTNLYTWMSNPADHYTDKISFGVNQQRVASQILVSYLGSTIVMETASFAQCAQEDGSYVEVFSSSDAVVCVYNFVGLGFEIPVKYSLNGRRLLVAVESDKIRETKENKLIDFTVNPFFGAGTMEEDGFILIPDGSGAVIDFNNGKTSDNRLTLDVMYGNLSKVHEERQPFSQPVLVPCFGINHNLGASNASVLAYVTDGATGGSIVTNVAGRETGFNYAYYTFLYREYATETMLDRTYAAKTRLVVSDTPISTEKYQICYTFGNSSESALSQMADAGRDLIFTEKSTESKRTMPVFLDMIMGVRVKQNFLGIPYRTLHALTTLEEAQTISEELSENGAQYQEIRMQGLTRDGYMTGHINSKLQISRKVGTFKELNALEEQKGISVYPSVELVKYNRSGNGASTFFSASLDLLLDTVRKPEYLVAARSEDESIKAAYLIKPAKITKLTERLVKSIDAKEVEGISPSSLAQGSYCNYSRKNESDVSATAAVLKNAVKTLAKSSKIMLEAPTVDFWQYSDSILNLPDDSSGYNLCDRTVPFLQMLISGSVSYSGSPVNFSGDETQAVLNCIRTGSAPSYKIFNAEYEAVSNTDANDLYAASYSGCKSSLIKGYKTVRDALDEVYGFTLTDFEEPQAGFTISVYSNGKSVLVNTTSQSVIWQGITVAPKTFAMVETEAIE